ncbi:CrcB family protein [Sinomonas halotolerans]|uniref:Fluoride-specific ion channel FluC n=1 Tax=Sinomonas halotolerans TaxID=1644133 RepID=A0ABU9X2A4_9MICC
MTHSRPRPAHDAGPPPPEAHAASRLPAPARPGHPFSPAVLALVAVGGAAGTLARWAVGEAVGMPGGFPAATLAVNLLGALALGVLLESLVRRGPDAGARRLVRLGLGTGFLGSFTTYSALAVDGVRLLSDGRAADAGWYLALTLLGGAAATLAGVAGAAWLHREDRRGLAAEARVAAHPQGGGARGAGRPPSSGGATAFGQNHAPRYGVPSESGGGPGVGDSGADAGREAEQ